ADGPPPPPPDRGPGFGPPGGPGGPPGGRRGGGRGGMSQAPTEVYQFAVLCLDRGSGKVLWQQIAEEALPRDGFKPGDGSFASASPVTDGEHVYAFFGSRGLYCYDMQGNLKWSKDLGKMRIKLGFGEGSSPALFGNIIVINWDHEGGSFIVALDKNSGKEL